MTINERIKFLRKSLSLTQVEFGEKIGLKKSASSKIEKDGEPINPRLIQLICSVFGVSEKWLVEGKGKMYVSDEDAILEKVTQMYNLTPEQEIFARHWLQLPPDAREAVVDYVVGVVESIKDNSDATCAKIAQDSDTKKDMPSSTSVFKPTAQQVTGKLPASYPQDSTAQQAPPAARAHAPRVYSVTDDVTGVTAQPADPADDGGSHDITVNDEELEVVQMMRREKTPTSGSSSCTMPRRA